MYACLTDKDRRRNLIMMALQWLSLIAIKSNH